MKKEESKITKTVNTVVLVPNLEEEIKEEIRNLKPYQKYKTLNYIIDGISVIVMIGGTPYPQSPYTI